MPRVIEVIESFDLRGKGTEESPMRRVRQYHTPEGEFLAENDPDINREWDFKTGQYTHIFIKHEEADNASDKA